jgi:hypothetical protein
LKKNGLASEKLSFDNNIGMKLKEPTINESLFVISKQQNILNVMNYKVSNR